MNRDRLYLVATAVGILAILFAAIFLPPLRSILLGSLIIAACWLFAIVSVGVVLLVRVSRAVGGPKSLSGTRCPKCRKRNAMREMDREFLHGRFPQLDDCDRIGQSSPQPGE